MDNNKQGELLRALDVEGLLRFDLLVVGTNAFTAYETLCGVKFPVGNEPTQEFDLAWCRGSSVSLAMLVPDSDVKVRKSLMAVHKLWLARKPERNAQKRPKDARQGQVLQPIGLAPISPGLPRFARNDSHPSSRGRRPRRSMALDSLDCRAALAMTASAPQ